MHVYHVAQRSTKGENRHITGKFVRNNTSLLRDLVYRKSMEWPTGSIVTQGCHATAAVLHTHRNDPDVSAYLDNLDSMHKVAYELKNQSHLDKACQILDENGIIYYRFYEGIVYAKQSHFNDNVTRWTEQPENIPTCLATKPYLRSDIADVLKKCKVSLYR
ncbi:peptidyl-tRNA hydrolase II domain-containing protein [Phlyctochytrium arcticum]|nr:peptidyl-tRNA hydrolase II domain-containing protein [Phlyctochytrium arcticum]